MIIQEYSSRFETPRVRISNGAFTNSNINVFFSEKIPFADRTGSRYAKSVVNLLEERLGKLNKRKDKLHIYELGAGTGILALRILNYLKLHNLSLYKQVVLHVSDNSRPAINQLSKLPEFKVHLQHVVFDVIDAANPKFKQKPLLIYFTFLIDSLPCWHIQIINGRIFEIQAQTFIDDNAQVIDGSKNPPEVLSAKGIYNLISSKNTQKQLLLAPQLINIFKEEHRRVAIDDLDNMSREEKINLKTFCSIVSKDRIFNYSFAARQCLQKCLSALEPGGFILFSDFGTFSRKPSNLSLWAEFGKTIFFAVDFYMLGKVFEKSGKTVIHTKNTSGGPQEMIIDTLGRDKIFEEKFQKNFGWNNQFEIDEFLNMIKIILQDRDLAENRKIKKINKLYKALPLNLRNAYQILNDLAHFLQLLGYNKQAIKYTQLLENEYGYAAGSYCFLIKARAYAGLGDFNRARTNYKKAAELGSPTAISELGNMRK